MILKQKPLGFARGKLKKSIFIFLTAIFALGFLLSILTKKAYADGVLLLDHGISITSGVKTELKSTDKTKISFQCTTDPAGLATAYKISCNWDPITYDYTKYYVVYEIGAYSYTTGQNKDDFRSITKTNPSKDSTEKIKLAYGDNLAVFRSQFGPVDSTTLTATETPLPLDVNDETYGVRLYITVTGRAAAGEPLLATASIEEIAQEYFNLGGPFDPFEIDNNAKIIVGGSADTKIPRPNLTFSLADYYQQTGVADNLNAFWFKADSLNNLYIRVIHSVHHPVVDISPNDCYNGQYAPIFTTKGGTEPMQIPAGSDGKIPTITASLGNTFWDNFFNKFYKDDFPSANNCPAAANLDITKLPTGVTGIITSTPIGGAGGGTAPGDTSGKGAPLVAADGHCTCADYVGLSQLIKSPAGALCVLGRNILLGLETVFVWLKMDKFNETLKLGQDLSQNDIVQRIWKIIRDLINSVFLVVFLISVLVTALKIESIASLASWQMKKMLPSIIMTMILVNFSLSIANLVILAMDSLVQEFKFDEGFRNLVEFNGPTLLGLFLKIALALVFIILIIYIFLVIWVRKIVILVLLMAAPLPYIGGVLPFKELTSFVGFWWTQFFKWAFMGPMTAMFLYVGVEAGKVLTNSAGADTFGEAGKLISGGALCGVGTGKVITITDILITGITIYLAATQPLKLGGGITSAIGGFVTGSKGIGAGGKINPMGWAKKAVGGTGKFYASKIGLGMGLPSVEEIKKGFAESRRVSLARSADKGEKKRAAMFGGVSAMSDIFENYANLKGVGRLPFTGTRQKRLRNSLVADGEKLKDLKEEQGKLMEKEANGEDVAKEKADIGDKIEALQGRIKTNDQKLMMLKPSNYNTRSERTAREMEEMKKLSGITRSEELIALFDKAEKEKNLTRCAAIYRQLANSLDENEIYNDKGLDSGLNGMQAFSKRLQGMGMDEQRVLGLQTDISYVGETKGHMNVAKSTVVEHGVMRQATQQEQIGAVLSEIKKWDAQKQARELSRLNFIDEIADPNNPGGKRIASLSKLGRELAVEVLPSIVSQIGRANMSMVENITTGKIMGELMSVEGVEASSLKALIGRRLGYNEKDDKAKIEAIDLTTYRDHMNSSGDDWQAFKAGHERDYTPPPKEEKPTKETPPADTGDTTGD